MAREQRILHLESITDGNVFSFVDGGPTRDGDDGQTRGRLKRALAKRVEGEGGKMFACFVLASPPSFSIASDDPLGELLRDQDGGWKLATPAWKAEQARRLETRAQRHMLAVEQVKAKSAGAVLDGLTKMLAAQQPQPAPARAPKGGAV